MASASAVTLSYALGVSATTKAQCSATATTKVSPVTVSAATIDEQTQHVASCAVVEGDDVAWTVINYGTWRNKAAWKSDDAWLSRPTDAVSNVKLRVSASVINIQ